jgi:hypothetical protein
MTSHMKKKKAKRYQEGGEAEDKKRGLAASNKEGSVGFFERLRMGNIDDPSQRLISDLVPAVAKQRPPRKRQQSRLTKDHRSRALVLPTARVHLLGQPAKPNVNQQKQHLR